MPNKPPDVIAIVGQTATGKTTLGATLAKTLDSEVISADSQLVYEGLNIGVARPTVEEMQGVHHHFIGFHPPTEAYSAGQYADTARPLIDTLLEKKKSPVLVGGTGFYIRALLQPDHLPDVPTNPALRDKLHAQIDTHGLSCLHEQLQKKDPRRAQEIHPNDKVRLIRALEIIELTGEPIPETPTTLRYPTRAFGLYYDDRERHIQVINQRIQTMITQGWLDEVQQLYTHYGNCYALQTAHGYPELVQVIQGNTTLEEAIEQIGINVRQYSKRQMTWFKKFPNIQWLPVDHTPQEQCLSMMLETLNK